MAKSTLGGVVGDRAIAFGDGKLSIQFANICDVKVAHHDGNMVCTVKSLEREDMELREDPQEDANSVGGHEGKSLATSIGDAIKAIAKAVKRSVAVLAVLAGGLTAGVAAEAQAQDHEGWDRDGNHEKVVVTDAGWEIRQNENRMHGLTAVIAQNSQVTPAGTMNFDIVCEKNDATPRVIMSMETGQFADTAPVSVRFDRDGARGQPGEEAVDISHGNKLAQLTSDAHRPGFGPSAFVTNIAASDSVMIEVPVGDREMAYYEFDTSEPELEKAVAQMGAICEVQTKEQIARSQHSVNERPRVPQRRPVPGTVSRGEVSETTLYGDARHECNKGLFSRERARRWGSVLGSLFGAGAGLAVSNDDDKVKGSLTGAAIGGGIGNKWASHVDRNAQEGRERLGVIDSGVFGYFQGGGRMEWVQFQDGSGCIVLLDGAGNEKNAQYHGTGTFAKERDHHQRQPYFQPTATEPRAGRAR